MKSVIIKFSLYLFVLLGIHYYAATVADGNTDAVYKRFTNGKHTSMIFGSSRAAQGIQPNVINSVLQDNFELINNFAFTISGSPYGDIYLDAIKKKLDKTTKENEKVFILEVMPWTISTKNNPEENPKKFIENTSYINKVKSVDKEGKPNLEFLIDIYPESWGQIMIREFRNKNDWFLHDNGWLEVKIPMDEKSIRKRTEKKVRQYQENNLPFYKFSPYRLNKLKETIDFLNEYGKVVLVRLPIGREIKGMEDQFMSDFDKIICDLDKECSFTYWNLSDSKEMIFTDGNHLSPKSGKLISEQIATQIKIESPSSCNCE